MDPWNHEITYSHEAWNLQLLKKQRVCSWHLLVRCCLSTALYWGVSSLFFTLSWGNQTSIEREVSGNQLSSPWSMSELSQAKHLQRSLGWGCKATYCQSCLFSGYAFPSFVQCCLSPSYSKTVSNPHLVFASLILCATTWSNMLVEFHKVMCVCSPYIMLDLSQSRYFQPTKLFKRSQLYAKKCPKTRR